MLSTIADTLRAKGARFRQASRRHSCSACRRIIARLEPYLDATGHNGGDKRFCRTCAARPDLTDLRGVIEQLLETCEPLEAPEPEEARAWNDAREALGKARIWRENDA